MHVPRKLGITQNWYIPLSPPMTVTKVNDGTRFQLLGDMRLVSSNWEYQWEYQCEHNVTLLQFVSRSAIDVRCRGDFALFIGTCSQSDTSAISDISATGTRHRTDCQPGNRALCSRAVSCA